MDMTPPQACLFDGTTFCETHQGSADICDLGLAALRAQLEEILANNGKLHSTVREQTRVIGLYNELLYAVARKHPNETRHQTALRYIQQAERGDGGSGAKEALSPMEPKEAPHAT